MNESLFSSLIILHLICLFTFLIVHNNLNIVWKVFYFLYTTVKLQQMKSKSNNTFIESKVY